MTSKINRKNFCPAPWTEVYIGFDSSGPCCVNYGIHKGLDPELYLKSKELKDLKPVNKNESDLSLAMKMIANAQKGPKEQIPSMGCNIKWNK